MEAAIRFLKNWMLPIAIVTGASSYLLFHFLPALHGIGPACHLFAVKCQPTLIGIMLFLQFVKMAPSDLKFHRWHIWLLLIQALLFLGLAWPAMHVRSEAAKIALECAMLCFICPTAAAAGVLTDRLGGSLAGVMTYTVLINTVAALLIPAVIPLLYPSAGLTFMGSVLRIGGRIFPILILPCLAAWLVRYTLPRLQAWLLPRAHWSFYIWGVTLTLSMVLATRALVLYAPGWMDTLLIVAVSIVCCIFQFGTGRLVGRIYSHGDKVTAGQSLGQKNTGFLIWLGYSYMTPVTSVAGGLYAIWHNLFNSWELWRMRKNAKFAS